MSSSTSSSESTKRRLMIAAKTAIVGLLLFAPAVLLFRLFVNVAVEELVGRSNAQIGFLPELARALPLKKKVMVFGSSMVQAGFEPLVFDKVMSDQGIESVSYNYGIGGLNPKYQELITRRIQEAFRRSDQKVDLTLIEFCPFQATKVRRHFTAFTDDQNVATLASNSELFRIMLEDPARGMHLLNIRYLRAGISAELLTTAVMIGISEEADDSPSPELLEASRRRRELQRQLRESLRKDVPENRTSPWDRRLRGGALG